MKRNVLIPIIFYFWISDIFSQDLSKLIISSFNQDNIATNICKDGNLGIIVFYSAIKNLNFEAVYPQYAIINSEYKATDNCYILCVIPQAEKNFSIKISATGFYTETYMIGSFVAKEKKIFMIKSEDSDAIKERLAQYHKVAYFDDLNLWIVRKDKKWGAIDEDGFELIPLKYKNVTFFKKDDKTMFRFFIEGSDNTYDLYDGNGKYRSTQTEE